MTRMNSLPANTRALSGRAVGETLRCAAAVQRKKPRLFARTKLHFCGAWPPKRALSSAQQCTQACEAV